jgi:hypothetical protein
VIISIVNASGIANTGSSFKASESNVDKPKAEALTLVIHDLPTSPQQMNIPPQVKVIKERSDDVVHVFHTRPKRQRQSSRKRRPSSNSNFRSRIKSPPSLQSSSFGGFKDFTSSDFRNPPSSPLRGFAEPPRAKNKYKFGPTTTQVEGYNYSPSSQKSKKSQKRERPAGGIQQNKNFGFPSPSQNQIDTQFAAAPSSASQNFFVDHPSIQTLQQHNNGFGNFPALNDAPHQSFNNDDSFVKPLNNFPLEKGPSYNFPKTSYGYPVRSINTPQGITKTNQFSVLGTNLDGSLNPTFPKLPNRYEQNEFSTPTRSNPSQNSNPFFNNNNNNNDEPQPTFPAQSNRVNFKQFNKFKNFDYDFKNRYPGVVEDDDDDEDDEADDSRDYVFRARRPLNPTTTTTTTTTPSPFTPKQRPKKKNAFGKFKNRPQQQRVPQTHNLDTDDLRDAYGEASDVINEYSSSAEDYKNFNPDFDSQRNTRRNHNPINLHELSSTLKSAKHQSPALRTALGDDFQIVSVHKSLEKDPRDVDFGFLKKHDYFNREFNVGSEINFGGVNHHQQPAVWPENFPKNHRLA